MLPRSVCWSHVGGDASTVRAIEGALSGHAAALADVEIYSTTSMKAGVNLDMLERLSPMLLSLVELDRRGGIFTQTDVEKAVSNVFATNGKTAEAILAESPACGIAAPDVVSLISYKVRVMLAHVRHVFDACTDVSSHRLS